MTVFPSPICLQFGDRVSSIIRTRISYAFRVFAAIYNYRVVAADSETALRRCIYGMNQSAKDDFRNFHIPARYQVRSRATPMTKLAKHRYGGEDFYLAHGIDEISGKPDWLGELFEWISSSRESDIVERDSVGRIPYSAMIFSRQGISPEKPYATLLMTWLESALRHGNMAQSLSKAPCPIPEADHIVVASHDIDFYYTNRTSSFLRLTKNLGIALHLYRSFSFFWANLRMVFEVLRGKRVGDYLPALEEAVKKYGIHSTLFIVSRQSHKRDPNYRLEDLSLHLKRVKVENFSTELHGSYRSIIEDGTLTSEALTLGKMTNRKPLGNRQHWLRFDQHEKLFRQIEEAGLVFDSSLGFAEMTGFRNGASFAFPPYDFKKEKAHEFLEIPLVLMDGNLEAASRSTGENPQRIADRVLNESRKWSWGGISVLWHNPMEPIQVPDKINRVFWNCANQQQKHREKWMSADQFLAGCLGRYQAAGLLESVKI